MVSWPEIAIISAVFLILFVYHIHLVYQVRAHPLTTSLGLTHHLRREWVEEVREEKRDILAVQTLRNWVMASSFLASAAILIGLGTINAALGAEKIAESSQALNMLGARNESLWLIKLLLLVVNFFFAFFNFTLSIRYYNHASFAINIPAEEPILTYETVAKIINRGMTHYTLGMRTYYLAVPLSLFVLDNLRY